MKTAIFKNMVSSISNIVNHNSIIPITDMVSIYTNNNFIYLAATDRITTAIFKEECNFQITPIVVDIIHLNKLLATLDDEDISLNTNKGLLVIKCGGTYKLAGQVDSNGISLDLGINIPVCKGEPVDVSSYKEVYKRNSFLIKNSVTMEGFHVYHQYSDMCIASDMYTIGCTKGNLGDIEVPDFMVKALASLTEPSVLYKVDNGFLIKSGEKCVVFIEYNQKPIFPIKPIISFIKDDALFKGSMKCLKKDLQQALKRQEIFKSIFQKTYIKVSFESNILKLENKDNTMFDMITTEGTIDCDPIFISAEDTLNALNKLDSQIQIKAFSRVFMLKDDTTKYLLTAHNGFTDV